MHNSATLVEKFAGADLHDAESLKAQPICYGDNRPPRKAKFKSLSEAHEDQRAELPAEQPINNNFSHTMLQKKRVMAKMYTSSIKHFKFPEGLLLADLVSRYAGRIGRSVLWGTTIEYSVVLA